MQNVIYAVIGVILTVAAMYMVAPSINNSSEAIKANIAVTEVSAVKNAAKMWLATESTTTTFNGITEATLATYIPELTITGGAFESKAGNGITVDLAPTTLDGIADSGIIITVDNLTDYQADIVEEALKDLTSTPLAPSQAAGTNANTFKVSVTIKG